MGWQDLKDLFRQAGTAARPAQPHLSGSFRRFVIKNKLTVIYITARNGAVIRADVLLGPDGRPKGSGIVVFESPDDARNAIQQFNGYDWQGRLLEVREDRYAGAPMGGGFGGRGGYGMGRGGGFGGGFGGRGGFVGGRGGFGGGFGGRGGYGGGGGYDHGPGPSVPPNPFTDYATSGTERSETIYVRNVRRLPTYLHFNADLP